MRCIVTGGAGFLGSHLTEQLVATGHSVAVIDDMFRGKQKNLEGCKGMDGYFLVIQQQPDSVTNTTQPDSVTNATVWA